MLIARVRSGSTFSHTCPPHICHAPACRVPCIVQRIYQPTLGPLVLINKSAIWLSHISCPNCHNIPVVLMATPQPTKQSRELSNAMYDDWKRKVGTIPAGLLLSVTWAMGIPSMHCTSRVAWHAAPLCAPPARMGRLISLPYPPALQGPLMHACSPFTPSGRWRCAPRRATAARRRAEAGAPSPSSWSRRADPTPPSSSA